MPPHSDVDSWLASLEEMDASLIGNSIQGYLLASHGKHGIRVLNQL